MTERLILAAVDPGDPAGVVVLEVPSTYALANVRVLALATVARGSTVKLEAAESWPTLDRRFAGKFAEFFAAHGVAEVAYEDPVDARPTWQGQKGVRREGGETRYRQGAYYAAAVYAAPATARVFAYPVRGKKGRPGWQGKRTRPELLRTSYNFLRAVHALPVGAEPPSDHVLMAVGVALYHIEQRRLARYYEANPHLDPKRFGKARGGRLPTPTPRAKGG